MIIVKLRSSFKLSAFVFSLINDPSRQPEPLHIIIRIQVRLHYPECGRCMNEFHVVISFHIGDNADMRDLFFLFPVAKNKRSPG